MKIVSVNEGWKVYNSVSNLITRSKRIYELSYSSGSNVHTYGNYVNTAQAALTLLKSLLEKNTSIEELSLYTDKAFKLAYDLILWVGKQSA